jgi:hypothetical protein
LRGNAYTHPIWAPDGQRFVTVRQSRSSHYVPAPPGDLVSGLRVNYEIMLHTRATPNVPRMLLLTDHGQLRGRPAWSPDGSYLLYALANDASTAVDIWWLDVATGATGRVTNDGASASAHWRPTARTGGGNLTRRAMLPAVLAGANTGAATPTPPGPTPFAYVTITPIPTATPLPTPVNPTAVPPRGISGRITYLGAPIAGINVNLENCSFDLNCTLVERAVTDAAGQYAFPLASTAGGLPFGYRVAYRNGAQGGNPDDVRFLDWWLGRSLSGYDYAERLAGGDIEIADVAFTAPAAGAFVDPPVTFQWVGRGFSDETYRWIIDTPGYDAFDNCDQPEPGGTATSFQFTSLNCSPFTPLPTGEQFSWKVFVARSGTDPGTGMSRSRLVTFTP